MPTESPPQKKCSASWKVWSVRLGIALLILAGLAYFVDLPLTQYLQAHVATEVNNFFKWVTKLGEGNRYMWLVLLAYVTAMLGIHHAWPASWKIGYERVTRSTLLLMSAWLLGGLLTAILKQMVARARPEVWFHQGYYGLGESFSGRSFHSFPSSHTLTAFVVAATLATSAPRWRWPLYLLATLVGISRIVMRQHYASDVVAAALLAMTVVHLLAPRFLNSNYRWPTRWPLQWFKRTRNR